MSEGFWDVALSVKVAFMRFGPQRSFPCHNRVSDVIGAGLTSVRIIRDYKGDLACMVLGHTTHM